VAKKKATKKGAPQKLLARGKGAIKRTPLHLADPAAVGEQEYELEDIVDHGKSHGVARWCCKWVGWEHTANTWEPLANLGGCEQFIARYNKESETKLKALEVELEAKNKKKREDKEQAEEAAAKKLQAEVESNKAMMASKGKLVAGSRRYATVWKWFEPLTIIVCLPKNRGVLLNRVSQHTNQNTSEASSDPYLQHASCHNFDSLRGNIGGSSQGLSVTSRL